MISGTPWGALGAAGRTRGSLEPDDGKHTPECLELQSEGVSFSNRGVWGDWAGAVKRWRDFHAKMKYLFSHFFEESLACGCVGPQIVFSMFLSALL